MARSPFQGTWQAGVRPTVVSAPDAIVYINGESDSLACNSCRRRFDINRYITSIQVDLNVDNSPGSASISMSIPRHTVDDFMIEGEPIISPMMEVEIYAKGFYLVEGLPQYYPIFWGLVTEVSDSYSGGEHTFSINCADILKWWEYCKLNVNPAMSQPAGQLGSNYLMGNIFHGANAYDVIWTLAQQSFGDIVNATGSFASAIQEQKQKETFRRSMSDIIGYWDSRFSKIRSNLVLYGVQGAAVRGDVLYESQPRGGGAPSSKFVSKAVRLANGGEDNSQLLFDPETINPFRSDIANTGNPSLMQSESQTKLEIANACKEAIGYEFFMDVTGDIVFKPPFYNLDILSNKPISWIQDIDIISWDFSSSEAEVVTQLQMQGTAEGGAMSFGVTADFNTPYTEVIDYHLLRKYGVRTQTFNAEYMSSNRDMFYAGMDLLDKMNAKRHRASVSIPMRPELRLGFPLYIAPKDQIWYTQGISHNIQMGGRAETSLTLSAKREKFIAPRGIGSLELTGFKKQPKAETLPLQPNQEPTTKELSDTGVFKLRVGDAAEFPQANQTETGLVDDPYAPMILRHPKTGRIVGYPNVVMAYTHPYKPDDATLRKNLGQRNSTAQRNAKKIRDKDGGTAAKENLDLVAAGVTQTNDRRLADKHMTNRYIYGLTSAGVYSYVHETTKAIKELVLLKAQNINVSRNGETTDSTDLLGTTAIMRPVSDERGFELVGHFRYGRGVSLREGSLVLTEGSKTLQKATVEAPLALSGGMFATLTAQSQGLTALTSQFPNPAYAVSHLAPDGSDLQTAATINPETKKPQIVAGESNLVETASLGSPKQKGAPISVEASQLSRALTLAEMKVKEDVIPNEDCVCLTGRSDLAFINSGYQIETLSTTAEDNTDLSSEDGVGTSTNISFVQSLRDQVQGYQDERDAAREAGDPIADSLYVKEISELEVQIGELSGDNNSAVSPRVYAPSQGEVITRVEGFLINLYEALDTPHQRFEKELRGNYLPGRTRAQILGGEPLPGSEVGDFSPPFSAPDRALGGDPRALALQGESSMTGMANAWKDFGDDLQRKPEQARLRGEIDRLDEKLQALDQEERELLEIQRTDSIVLLGDGTSVNQRLDSIDAEREKAQTDRNQAQGKLNVLNNEDR